MPLTVAPLRFGPVAIEFPAVPMGTRLRGHTGIIGDDMFRGRAPVRLSVNVDGREIGATEEPPATPGWHAFQFDTAQFAGQAHAVSFAVTSPDAQDRSFCFDALTLP